MLHVDVLLWLVVLQDEGRVNNLYVPAGARDEPMRYSASKMKQFPILPTCPEVFVATLNDQHRILDALLIGDVVYRRIIETTLNLFGGIPGEYNCLLGTRWAKYKQRQN